ncbi:MAG: CoA transferase [Rhizobiales bacterium]|nr:CoA transferase [Hyphomicrobiales bacterium]
MLSGVRVVELGQILAAPFAAEILGDLGADVIKVEKPKGGDDARGWGPPYWEGDAALFHQMNRNKRSLVLDLKTPEGLRDIVELIGTADVFVHNLRPGAAEALGLGAGALREKYPGLIYADIGAFGHKGPLHQRPGYELLVQAFSGVMSITGEPGGMPVRTGPSINDLGTGMWAAIGILAALNNRARTGEGCLLQTSLFETALCWAGIPIANHRASGSRPERMGSGHPSVVPYGAFPTATGPLIVAAGNDRLFERLAKALGNPQWARDDRFAKNDGRVRARAELERLITGVLAQKSRDDWIALFEAEGIPCAPIMEIPEVLAHPQTHALEIMQKTPGSEAIELVGLPLSINGKRPGPRRPRLELGADTSDVLQALRTDQREERTGLETWSEEKAWAGETTWAGNETSK